MIHIYTLRPRRARSLPDKPGSRNSHFRLLSKCHVASSWTGHRSKPSNLPNYLCATQLSGHWLVFGRIQTERRCNGAFRQPSKPCCTSHHRRQEKEKSPPVRSKNATLSTRSSRLSWQPTDKSSWVSSSRFQQRRRRLCLWYVSLCWPCVWQKWKYEMTLQRRQWKFDLNQIAFEAFTSRPPYCCDSIKHAVQMKVQFEWLALTFWIQR